ncbi:hypothetical protein L3Q82_008710, partial [Scortum barcoo]
NQAGCSGDGCKESSGHPVSFSHSPSVQYQRRRTSALWVTVSLLGLALVVLTVGLVSATRTDNVPVAGYYSGITLSFGAFLGIVGIHLVENRRPMHCGAGNSVCKRKKKKKNSLHICAHPAAPKTGFAALIRLFDLFSLLHLYQGRFGGLDDRVCVEVFYVLAAGAKLTAAIIFISIGVIASFFCAIVDGIIASEFLDTRPLQEDMCDFYTSGSGYAYDSYYTEVIIILIVILILINKPRKQKFWKCTCPAPAAHLATVSVFMRLIKLLLQMIKAQRTSALTLQVTCRSSEKACKLKLRSNTCYCCYLYNCDDTGYHTQYFEFTGVSSCWDVIHLHRLLWASVVLNVISLFLGIITAAILGAYKDMEKPKQQMASQSHTAAPHPVQPNPAHALLRRLLPLRTDSAHIPQLSNTHAGKGSDQMHNSSFQTPATSQLIPEGGPTSNSEDSQQPSQIPNQPQPQGATQEPGGYMLTPNAPVLYGSSYNPFEKPPPYAC